MTAPTMKPEASKTDKCPRERSAQKARPGPSRRQILVGAGGVAALVVGYTIWPRERAVNLPVRDSETLINAWLKIDADGRITVAVPQAEMGQGVYTALPQLLAHELGADWQMVAVEPAPLHPVYANRAFVESVGADLPALLSGIAHWTAVSLVERFELQVTGGSTSVRAFWEPLRAAGAAARELLIRTAARRLQVDPETLDTEGSHVVGGSKRVAFTELLPDIDVSDAPTSPALRTGSGLLGRDVPRLDIPAKVNGTAEFGADVRLPGMLYAAVRGAPLGAGSRARFGPAAAGAEDKVIGVVSGDRWFAVVGETWWAARQALDLVDAEYRGGDLAESTEIEERLSQVLADPDSGSAFVNSGDAADALAGEGVATAEYAVPFLAHACMEPMTATARIEDGRAEVWVPTQSQTLTAWKVADALGLPTRAVKVYPTLLGGGFGRKVEVDAAVQAAMIAREVGRPVQLIWHREEDMARDMYRPAVRARLQAVIGPDKTISAFGAKLAAPDLGASFMSRMAPAIVRGIAGGAGDSRGMVAGLTDLPYDIPAQRIVHANVDMPIPLGYWRSVEHSYGPFFSETFMDELAARAGVDPLAFRLRHMDRQGRAAKVLMLAASRGTLLAPAENGTGRGIALHESFGTIVAQVAHVEASGPESIRVRKVNCVVDCGQVVNPDIVRSQMEGSIIFGLSAALYGQVRFETGEAVQQNFDSYPLLTLAESPEIEVEIVSSDEAPGGVGEPGVPPIAPAVANAYFAATGQRLRTMPFVNI